MPPTHYYHLAAMSAAALHSVHSKAPSTPATCRSNMSNVASTCRMLPFDMLPFLADIAHLCVLVVFAVTHSEVHSFSNASCTKTRTTVNPRPHPTRPHLPPLCTVLCYCSNDNSRQTQLKFVVCIHVLTDVTSRVIETYDVYMMCRL